MHSQNTKRMVEAIEFAGNVHRGKQRLLSNNPFIVHPMHVAIILENYIRLPEEEDVLIAAILHDTIEDSEPAEKTTKEVLASMFGENVARIVDDVSIKSLDDTLESKKASRESILAKKWDSQLLKVADIVSNTAYNIFRAGKYSKKEIEEATGENMDEKNRINRDFLAKINNERVRASGILAHAEEVITELEKNLK
ncbi:MAG: HD domain-containing protein [Candidatus Pacebacteria bacterium]|nr:HD domain-containing protein [Candidatus Paceibacterota bacterium]